MLHRVVLQQEAKRPHPREPRFFELTPGFSPSFVCVFRLLCLSRSRVGHSTLLFGILSFVFGNSTGS